jgi:hypothetical protein
MPVILLSKILYLSGGRIKIATSTGMRKHVRPILRADH